jgi:NAD+ synthase (glutamine-hydrolysing)
MKWQDFLEIYRQQTNFNVESWVNNKCRLLNEYLGNHTLSGTVVSVSGGIDSAVILALLKYTSQMPDSNLKKIMALSQPIHSSDWALERAQQLCNTVDIPLTVIDQTDIHQLLVQKFEQSAGQTGASFSQGQLRSYLRTPANYYATQLLREQGFPAVVIGTGNKDEDGYLAYFCKYGDGAVDVQLISDLHKSQVFQVGRFLHVPESILSASPSADLWQGHTDEEEMGFPYDFVEFYTGYYLAISVNERIEFLDKLDEPSLEEFVLFENKCINIHKRNAHKLGGIVNL